MGRSAGDLRARPAPHAERRGVLPRAHWRRTRLDFIVNNACQTVRRPPDFYAHMMDGETASLARAAGARARGCSAPTKGCAAITCCRKATMPTAGARPPHCRGAGLTHAAQLSQVPLLPEELAAQKRSVSRRAARSGSAAGGSARAEFLAAADGGSAVGRAAGGAAGQRDRAVHHQRAAQAADAAHAGARQAHRQRVGGGRAVLPASSRPRGIRTRTWRRRRST